MSRNRFALQLQLLESDKARVLVAASLYLTQSGANALATRDAVETLLELDVPPPSNPSAAVNRAIAEGLAIRKDRRLWTLTPLGWRFVENQDLDFSQASKTVEMPGALFDHVEHTIIPSWAAPPRWATGIKRLHERYPFDLNVFCMTRFPGEHDVHLKSAIDVARNVLSEFGLTLHLASDSTIEDDLLGNVGAYMWACKYGLGIVEDRAGRGINYNVVIELGAMIFSGRRCALLKDVTAPDLPTDLSGQIYKPVDLADSRSVEKAVRTWASADLRLEQVTQASNDPAHRPRPPRQQTQSR